MRVVRDIDADERSGWEKTVRRLQDENFELKKRLAKINEIVRKYDNLKRQD